MRTFAFCFVFVLGSTAFAAPHSVAILDLQTKLGFDPEKRDIFVEFLQTALRDLGFTVIGKRDIETLIGLEKMKEALNCDSSQCLAEIGGALGVDEIVTGTIANLSGALVVTLKRIDANHNKVLQQVSRRLNDATDRTLLDVATPLALELFRGTALPEVPRVKIAGSEPTTEAGPALHGLRLVVDDDGVAYEVTVESQGTKLTCAEPVTKDHPCFIPFSTGEVLITVKDTFDKTLHLKDGLTVYHLGFHKRWPRAIPAIGLPAGVVVAIVGAVFWGNNNYAWQRIEGQWLVASGVVVGVASLIALPIVCVMTGNVSVLNEPTPLAGLQALPTFALTPILLPHALAGMTVDATVHF